ncbi:DUF4920 domain-containing protein [Pedobacter sp. SD-b]|uniref:DUF4920 domain-containing protein n=1 Tax=Pedobacter segetis TaxID=2793069 RepID=A0ABS1BJQ6_9SPHI|nr:DUF4920 domain-containing protein [Pedobacter segetis]MBK0383037.1 DUF4920 domain-containing protein [Pedobacter segetis]
MIKFFQTFAVVCLMAFTAFAQEPVSAAKGVTYGEKIDAKNLIPVNGLSAKMGNNDILAAKIYGTVTDVCTKKGCWMKLDNGDGTTTMVTFKDYKFFMPKDIVGKKVALDGVSKQVLTSVAEQKHYLEDAGKSKEEIAKVTKPKKEIKYEAKGVLVL